MTNIIFQKEWLEFKRDKRLRWAVGILYFLFVVSLITGIHYYKNAISVSNTAAKKSYAQWLAQGKKNPHSAAHYGFYAYKPLSPLAIIDKGMEDYLGQAVWLEAHNQNEVKEREANDAGSIVRFGSLTVGFVFHFIFPLTILLIGYNIINKEREYGTLPLLLGSATGTWQIFKGKLVALYSLSLLIFLPMLLTVWSTILLVAGSASFIKVLPRLFFMSVCYFLYTGIWVLLSLYVSARVKQSSVSLTALLALWVMGVFFIPRMSGFVSKLIYNTPSSFTFSHNIRLDNELGIDRKSPAATRQKKFEDSLLKNFNADSISQLPLNIRGLNLQRGEEYGYLIFEKNYGSVEQTYQSQDILMNWLYLLSPAQSMHTISTGISGTDISKHIHFAEQAEIHRRLIAKTMNDDIARNSAGTEIYEVSNTFWKTVPPFQYKEQNLATILKQQWLNIAAMLVWLGGLFWMIKRRSARFNINY